MPSDTDPEVESLMIEGYRAMSPAQKFARVQELNEMVLQVAAAGIEQRHGKLPERELRLRLASLWLDSETMIRAFGWDPDKEGR